MSTIFKTDIEKITKENTNYRQVLFTNKFQLVIMSIKPKQSIGMEVHNSSDQFIRVESGEALAETGRTQTAIDTTEKLTDGFAIVIPAGTWHNITNVGSNDLKLYTVYSSPEHIDQLVEKDKLENDVEVQKAVPLGVQVELQKQPAQSNIAGASGKIEIKLTDAERAAIDKVKNKIKEVQKGGSVRNQRFSLDLTQLA